MPQMVRAIVSGGKPQLPENGVGFPRACFRSRNLAKVAQ